MNCHSVQISNEIDPWWDDFLSDEFNRTHRKLVTPNVERLLGLGEGNLALDIACGSGLFSRRMAQLGVQIVAIDASKVFLERAKARTVEYEDRIQYALMDATDRDQF